MIIHIISLGFHTEHLFSLFVKYGADKAIFVYSIDNEPYLSEELNKIHEKNVEDTMHAAKELCGMLNIKCEFLKVESSNFEQNLNIFRKIIKNEDNTIINLTGGRKIVTLALHQAALMEYKKVFKITYVENRNIIEIPKSICLYENISLFERKIVNVLMSGEKSISEISNLLGVKRPSVSAYIPRLEEKGLISVEKKGRSKIIRIVKSLGGYP